MVGRGTKTKWIMYCNGTLCFIQLQIYHCDAKYFVIIILNEVKQERTKEDKTKNTNEQTNKSGAIDFDLDLDVITLFM